MKCEDEQCFTSGGLIIDPVTMSRKAFIQLPDSPFDFLLSSAVVPDTKHGRIVYLIQRQSGVYIESYDLTSLKNAASYKIPDLHSPGHDLLIWNDNQFAFSTGDQIVLVPMSLLQAVP